MTKHTILFLAANPVGTDRLALDKEARAIQVELERSGFRDSFELVTRWAAEPLDLLRELRKLKPSVVHFSGLGSFDGADAHPAAEGRDVIVASGSLDRAQHGLYFQGPDGRPQVVSAESLAQVFGAAGSSVKLITLSACYSDAQAAALVGHIDCVVGMRGLIRNDAARSFAIGFYGGLGERESVAAAYRHGCAAIGLEGLPDGDAPRFRVRDGVDAELIVLADLASGDPAAQSHSSVSPPAPEYANAELQALSERLRGAHARKQTLRNVGLATDEVDREILQLRRQLREGGQLRAGDALGDGRYLLIKPVGRGGFAVVWEAHDLVDRRRVAIKVLHVHLAGDVHRRERFFRGARVMMELKHSAVVCVYDARGEDEAFYYFVMEFVPGGDLRDSVLSERVEAGRRLSQILHVGDALAEAHSKQLVHRDIKPSNILIAENGDAKLTDFDLVGAQDTTGGTRTGALGTFVYSAPECLDKPQEATARADVFSLGMTAIFCLSGEDLSMDTFRDPATTLARLDCSVPVRVVLKRAVAWEPDLRFPHAAAMMEALRSALGEGRAAPMYCYPGIVAQSEAMTRLLTAAESAAKLDTHTLITGPIGSGKSLIAQFLHQNSQRSSSIYRELDCASIPEDLIDAELFGAEARSSKQPSRRLVGMLERSESGTLHIANIDILPFGVQGKLLQLLQTRVYFRVGGKTARRADVRILASTNANLRESVANRLFREDLGYQLSVLSLTVCGLDERQDDIPALIEHFHELACERHRLPRRPISGRALVACRRAHWPGNARQLANLVEIAAVQAEMRDGKLIDVQDFFSEDSTEQSACRTYREATREFQREYLLSVLESNDWDIATSARQLDLARIHVYELIRSFDLRKEDN